MGNSNLVAGLDIGSGRVCCVIAEHGERPDRIRVLGGGAAECKGLKAGMVLNIDEAARTIKSAVEEAERKADRIVTGVLLGVRGPHLQSFESRGTWRIARMDQEITPEDVSSVIENSKAVRLSSGMEFLEVVPQRFSLDRLIGVPNPVGMEGSLLEVGTHIIAASGPALTNLAKAVAAAGFRLDGGPVCTLLAVGELTVAAEEKELGVLLVDMGGHTTSVAIYAEGAVHFSKEFRFGAENITRDMAYGMGSGLAAARSLKERYGAAYTALIDPDKVITYPSINLRFKREIRQAELLRFIQPRVEEMFALIGAEIQKSPYAGLPGGVVMAGGGALLPGMPDAAAELLELPQARLAALVHEGIECPPEYAGQDYLGAVALAAYPALGSWVHVDGGTALGTPLFRRLMNWFSDFI
ncbi:MAG: cell division protein FtsA [Elusimicrobiales bacterium]|nr:cell division protein FtsA [Elusimicrobiales bacterium]